MSRDGGCECVQKTIQITETGSGEQCRFVRSGLQIRLDRVRDEVFVLVWLQFSEKRSSVETVESGGPVGRRSSAVGHCGDTKGARKDERIFAENNCEGEIGF